VKIRTAALVTAVCCLLAVSAIANAGSQCRETPHRAGGLGVSDILLGNILMGHYDVSTCTSPDVQCGSTCANLLDDNNNCGTCGNECSIEDACIGGTCECFDILQPCEVDLDCCPYFECLGDPPDSYCFPPI
jgi:hypothetical protein